MTMTLKQMKKTKINKDFFIGKKVLEFDIETNGIDNFRTLDSLKTIHCVVVKDFHTGQVYSFKPNEVKEGLRLLRTADYIVGHNVLAFDIPAIKKLYPKWSTKATILDTLVLARLIYADIEEKDFSKVNKGLIEYKTKQRKLTKQQFMMFKNLNTGKQRKAFLSNLIFPSILIGRHSLEAWGYRISEQKGSYGKQDNAWDRWTPDMQKYCIQDVEVTHKLFTILIKDKNATSLCACELEHRFHELMIDQEKRGVSFDVKAAQELEAILTKESMKLEGKLKKIFPPLLKPYNKKELTNPFVPKRDDKKTGRKAGCPLTRTKWVEFKPSSQQIAERLTKMYGWQPTEFTDAGNPKCDDEVLSKLDYPEIPMLCSYLLVNKRLGQLNSGKQAWLKQVVDGRIHGTVNGGGAVTGRCTHSNPNLSAVPKANKVSVEENPKLEYIINLSPTLFGKECRSLFRAGKGYKIAGCDASGLEFRCLAHFLKDPKIVETVINGKKEDGTDIHSLNMRAAGLSSRDDAKTFIYAFMYGGGDAKLGSIVKKDKAAGAKLRKTFLKKIPSLKNFLERVSKKVEEQGFLLGLDGRKLHVRSDYKALNLLLQSAGALVMKKALILLKEMLDEEGWQYQVDYAFVLNIHDEIQAEVKPEYIDRYKELARLSIQKAGDYFKFYCPLDGEAADGDNWADTH